MSASERLPLPRNYELLPATMAAPAIANYLLELLEVAANADSNAVAEALLELADRGGLAHSG